MPTKEILALSDTIETIAGAMVQHGDLNDRVYLMKLPQQTPAAKVIRAIEDLARENDYGKIFVKTPQTKGKPFQSQGYEVEAQVPGFYSGEEAALFMGKYLDHKRKQVHGPELLQEVIDISCDKPTLPAQGLPPDHAIEELGKEHVQEMAAIYDQVFATYPFPINDPDYLRQVMGDSVRSFGVFAPDGSLVSLAACEIDHKAQNVEMTDFATLREHRGQGLAHELLLHMEEAMRADKMKTAYTIARAQSFGMNITFSKAGYNFGGTLRNNTNISGAIESMNVWHKKL